MICIWCALQISFSVCPAPVPLHPQNAPCRRVRSQNGQLAFSPLFIDNKVESSHIKQIIISDIIPEHLGYGNLFVDRIFIPGEPDIFQRMCQVFINAASVSVENGWIPSALELICFSVILDSPFIFTYCTSSYRSSSSFP